MKEDEAPLDFFDTSALVKRYHRETGTDVVDAAFEDRDATRVISNISVIVSGTRRGEFVERGG